ncbi:ATP-binding protein [Halobacteria archaeon AArc-m2/3/4]|uniref:ATP-binding protein n=1 Tax=Natronoglomus mannanivorans TaxID=2979990 RepID=A0ABT2Q8B2_9EURY|nr:ATP-binding protein [Halobacteria archaeon AArc-m2/3/4]
MSEQSTTDDEFIKEITEAADELVATWGYYLLGLVTAAVAFTITLYAALYFQRQISNFISVNPIIVLILLAILLLGLFFVLAILIAWTEEMLEQRREDLYSSTIWVSGGSLVAAVTVMFASGLSGAGVEGAANLLPMSLSESTTATGLTTVSVALSSLFLWSVDKFEPREDSNYDPEYVEANRRAVRAGQPQSAAERYAQNTEQAQPTRGQAESSTNGSNQEPDDEEDFMFDWQKMTDVSMADVGGMDRLKRQLRQEIIRPLTTEREKAEKLGIPTPNILFYGPPGTGKTFIAKALATELDLPFVRLTGADVQAKWINEGPERIKTLFAEGKKIAAKEGGAVIFLDELDAVLPDRSGRTHEENRKVVNEFLAHLQDTGEHNVIFIGATNRREDLDTAATRRGRIDREIEIGLPDQASRKAILRAQLADRSHGLSEYQLESVAQNTDGWTAADLTGLVEDAARIAAFERNDESITLEDLKIVFERQVN